MKKKLVVITSIVAILALAVGGILAYLTSTASVTNTFTVGDVEITLDEAVVDENGKALADGSRTDEGNEYHLIPGLEYDKDPTVTVAAGSEESYVRMLVTIDCLKELDEIFEPYPGSAVVDIFQGYDPNVWECVKETRNAEGTAITYEFRYKAGTVSGFDGNGAEKELKLPALFTSFKIPGFITGEQLKSIENMKIVVVGNAIQAAGFEADAANGMSVEDVAWAAFEEQYKNAPPII